MLPTAHCLVPSHSLAEQILQQLQSAGVPQRDISYVRYSSPGDRFTAPSKSLHANTDSPREKAAGGASAGAVAGAAVGVGFLMSIILSAPLMAIAPAVVTVAAVAGAGFGVIVAMTALEDYGVPEADRNEYEKKLRAGSALVVVSTEDEDELERARKTMEQAGARPRVIRLTKRLT